MFCTVAAASKVANNILIAVVERISWTVIASSSVSYYIVIAVFESVLCTVITVKA